MPDINNMFIDNFLGTQLYVDIMVDCAENEGGFYCRVYDKTRFTDCGGYVMPIDFGDYLDDFCIDKTHSKEYIDVVSYILDYVKNNITKEDLA